jgi:uncharacterized protein (TIGR03000 family)
MATCYGGYGGYASCYGCHGCGGGAATPAVRPPAVEPAAPAKKASLEPNRATVTVQLPADARLFVDGVSCPLTSDTRSFETPPLENGKSYFYMLRAEMIRNGQTRTLSRQVFVQAGQRVTANLNEADSLTTAQR